MAIEQQQIEQFFDRVLIDQLDLHNCRYHARQGAWSTTHDSQEHFLTFVEHGSLQVQLEDNVVTVNGGECLWVQPGTKRTVLGTVDGATVRHINLRFSLRAGRTYFGLSASKKPLYQGAQKIRPELEDIIAWHLSYERPASRLRYLVYGVLWHLIELQQSKRGEAGRLSERQAMLLQRFITNHMTDSIGPADMAKALDLSHDYFTRVFKKTYGVNPRQYLLEERLRQAAVYLIETSVTIKDAGASVGFEDNNYFCRQFKRIMKLTPTQFRNRGYLPVECEMN